jgi:predicted MFS family arabinose efflux permease
MANKTQVALTIGGGGSGLSAAIDSRRGRIALMVAHCAGMIDLVALPVWVGALITHYRFDPQRAGGLATLFLVGAVLASVLLAPRLLRLRTRAVGSVGFAVSAVGFGLASASADFTTLAVLHALCGLGTGAALSITHGTIARSERPHRLFAIVNMALGVFAVLFLGITPQIIAALGGQAMFIVFGTVMALAALTSLIAFPSASLAASAASGTPVRVSAPMPAVVWFGIVGIACMTVVQAMTFSFLERVGSEHGFERQAINGVLIALGLVNLFPAGLAALLEKRWSARNVMLAGPLLQAGLCALIMSSTTFLPYAVAASVFAAVLIFVHTFAFGLIARLEPSGRALAATPAMVMTGSAIGPILGGTLVKWFGYGSLGIAAVIVAVVAVFCFSRLPSAARGASSLEAIA